MFRRYSFRYVQAFAATSRLPAELLAPSAAKKSANSELFFSQRAVKMSALPAETCTAFDSSFHCGMGGKTLAVACGEKSRSAMKRFSAASDPSIEGCSSFAAVTCESSLGLSSFLCTSIKGSCTIQLFRRNGALAFQCRGIADQVQTHCFQVGSLDTIVVHTGDSSTTHLPSSFSSDDVEDLAEDALEAIALRNTEHFSTVVVARLSTTLSSENQPPATI